MAHAIASNCLDFAFNDISDELKEERNIIVLKTFFITTQIPTFCGVIYGGFNIDSTKRVISTIAAVNVNSLVLLVFLIVAIDVGMKANHLQWSTRGFKYVSFLFLTLCSINMSWYLSKNV